jgi:hypothetical protein
MNNKMIGMIGTTLGGGLVGAGIQRTYMAGNRISSGLSKLLGKGGLKFDNTTWTLLICGILVLAAGVYFTTRKK